MQAMSTRNAHRFHDKYDKLFADLETMHNAVKENAPGAYMHRYQNREHAPSHLQPTEENRSAPEPPNLSYMYSSNESSCMHPFVPGNSGTTASSSSTDIALGTADVSTTQASTDNLDAATYSSVSSIYSASTRSTRSTRSTKSGVQHNLFSSRFDRSTHTPYYTPGPDEQTGDDFADVESWENFSPGDDAESSHSSAEAADPSTSSTANGTHSDIPSQVSSLVRTESLNDDEEPRLPDVTRAPRYEEGPEPSCTGSRLACFWKRHLESFRQSRKARKAEREAECVRKANAKAAAKTLKKMEKTAAREWAARVHNGQIAAMRARRRIEDRKREEKKGLKAWKMRVKKRVKEIKRHQRHRKRLDRERLGRLRKQMAADRAAAEREGRAYRFPLD
ncbi:hypothetical protein F503_02721 [Ophiostoma piceae UAMH 11346]|uniref:Uncharacterized protein n=1 Tax=Ophiostoma piceae (strain UAMH 11346) TaxID=1262450 RepID=S3CJH9_OPHP1|nr:hypothetical protein F503_02721 [Ophiostoma piceae UAMH 11346]